MTRNRRRWLLIMGLLAALLVGGGLVGAFTAGAIAQRLVVRAARSRGVVLTPKHIDLGWGWIRIRDATAALEGVPSMQVAIDRATIDLDGLSPSRVEARGVSVALTGTAPVFLVDLGSWAKRHPDTVAFPFAADHARVSWRETPDRAAWLALDEGMVVPRGPGAQLRADRARVLGLSVGPVGAVWETDALSVRFGFGDPDPSASLVHMKVDRKTGKGEVRLRPVALSKLAGPLGVKLPIDGKVIIEATASLSLEPAVGTRELEGTLHAKLRGYVPPHPKELDGIVFGDVTSFDTHFRISGDRRLLHLEKSRVSAGAFVLDGSGTVRRQRGHAQIAMSMAGDIPCTSLAKSAAVSRVGGVLGQFLGDAASRALAGAVHVTVQVHADSRHLDEARLDQAVRVGCTLRLP